MITTCTRSLFGALMLPVYQYTDHPEGVWPPSPPPPPPPPLKKSAYGPGACTLYEYLCVYVLLICDTHVLNVQVYSEIIAQ